MTQLLRVVVGEARSITLPFGSLSSEIYVVVASAGVTLTTNVQQSRNSQAVWDEIFDFQLIQGWQQMQTISV